MSIVAISETAGSLGKRDRPSASGAPGLSVRRSRDHRKKRPSDSARTSLTPARAEEKPTLWERLTDTQHRYKLFVEAIILEMAGGDNVVLAGLASAHRPTSVSHALRSAPMLRSGSGPTAWSNSRG
jgi:hypothetical protein